MTSKLPLTKLDSSLLAGFHYDPQSRDLTVEFKDSGRRYVYKDVTAEKIEALHGADSAGAYFNRRIKGWHLSDEVL